MLYFRYIKLKGVFMTKVEKISKTLMISLIFSFFLVLSALILLSCGETIPIKSINFTQTEIELFKGQGTYLTLDIQPNNANKYALKWSSSDSEIATINSRGRVETYNYGTAILTCAVVDSDLKATCTVLVTDGQVFDMYVNEDSVIKNYFVGQSFISTGMTVWAKYQSGVDRQLSPEEYQIIVPDVLNVGDVLQIVYKNYTYEIPLNVIEDYVTDIEILSNPIKTEYYIGENFDPTGLELNLVYASGKTQPLADYTYSQTPFTYNDNSITLNYQDFSIELPLTIKANHTVSIYSTLQSVVDSANPGDSIMITGSHYNVNTVVLPKSKNLTIYGVISQDGFTSITPNNDNPAFIIVDDTEDDKNYQTTIANLSIISRDTNDSPLIVLNDTETNLKNLTLTLDNLSFSYNTLALSGEKSPSEDNFENITLDIINCQFTSTTSSQSAIYLKGLQNSEINIINSNIDGYNGVTMEENSGVDVNISNTIIDGDNIPLNLIKHTNASITINQNSYLLGFNPIYLNGENNTVTIENAYLTALLDREDLEENSSCVISLKDGLSNTLQIDNTYVTTSYAGDYINATLYIVCIKDGENLKSANNQVTFSGCTINFSGEEKFLIEEESQTSTITENAETEE